MMQRESIPTTKSRIAMMTTQIMTANNGWPVAEMSETKKNCHTQYNNNYDCYSLTPMGVGRISYKATTL